MCSQSITLNIEFREKACYHSVFLGLLTMFFYYKTVHRGIFHYNIVMARQTQWNSCYCCKTRLRDQYVKREGLHGKTSSKYRRVLIFRGYLFLQISNFGIIREIYSAKI